MEIDQFLSQPPAPVRDEGFSQRVLLALYRKRLHQRNVVLAASGGVLLLVLLSLPVATLVPVVTLQLTALMTSPLIPWLGAGAAILLVAFRPRLMRF